MFLRGSKDVRTNSCCGGVKTASCWAFSAVATVEGLNKIVNGELVTLSEQELVDCERGCRRSYPHIAYRYIMSNGGIDSDESYPYVSQDGVRRQCRADKVSACNRIDQTINEYWYDRDFCWE